MKITLEFDSDWAYVIAGETFKVDASKIPKDTWVAIVRDRLGNKGRDTWADSNKVTADCTRQELWALAMQSVYDGSWVPGSGKGKGTRRKTMSWEEFLHNSCLKEAKRMIGKLGFKGKDGYHFKPNDEGSILEAAMRLAKNDKFAARVSREWELLHTDTDLDL